MSSYWRGILAEAPQGHFNELKEVVELAEKLGSRGLRFGYLVHTLPSMAKNLELSLGERREAEAIVWQLQRTFLMPIVMAPGYYITDLFPCAPLKCRNLTSTGRAMLPCAATSPDMEPV